MSDKDIFSAALNGKDLPEDEATDTVEVTNAHTEEVAQEATEAVEQENTDADEGQGEGDQAGKHHGIPSWRLKEVAEQRRAAEERAAKLERELHERDARLRQIEQAKAEEAKKAEGSAEFDWENPDQFVKSQVQTAEQRINEAIRKADERASFRWAVKEHGKEKVEKAYQAFGQAMQAGDPQAHAVYQQAMQSDDPYDLIMAWDRQTSTLKEIGGDLNGYRSKLEAELLANPEFLQRALEAAKAQATPVTKGLNPKPAPQGLPSLSRQTAAAHADDEEEDAAAVFSASMSRKRG